MSVSQANPIASKIEIRPLTTVDEFRRCVDLQVSVWGFDELDVMPLRFFVVASHIGGQVFGAFTPHREMIGFLCALSGMKGDLPFIHSHMLAVVAGFRNQGVAKRLKLAQRVDALQRGFRLVEWTFDPLELKNAYFNIQKLGAIVRHYSPNHYGITSSRLQAGLPTDRLIAEWWIHSDRVKRILGEAPASTEAELAEGQSRVEVPADVIDWKSKDVPRAEKIQAEIRQRFQDHFKDGFNVTGFERGKEHSAYILTKNFKIEN
ncbi:MAG: GNAT family N-acetyltransferase [Acidobacteriia bacterium]|nr:GNAT family N-acetyltransferase [Terriglobia bacterium]